jgi:16S rRNA (guanine966-N2)-methyltransferase
VVRVVAGRARGRRLPAKLPKNVRPTTDLVREAVFSILASRVELDGAHVADLYCGSGAMGIEALSRGAAACVFVDEDARCLAAARANLEAVRLDDVEASFVRARLPGWTSAESFDVACFDPPYGALDVDAMLQGVTAAICVVESDREFDAPVGWITTVQRRYGSTLVTVLEHDPEVERS